MTTHSTTNNFSGRRVYQPRRHHLNVDLVDPVQVPFMGFIRNDEETLKIMAKAATIVPKACDILGISLSDSESEEDDTAEVAEERSPQSHDEISRINNDSSNNNNNKSADNQEVQEARPKPKPFVVSGGGGSAGRRGGESPSPVQGDLGSHIIRKSRKRCASTPSTLGQSNSSSSTSLSMSSSGARRNINAGGDDNSLALGVREQSTLNPPKKRRFPSISSTPDATTSTTAANTTTTADDAWGNLSPEESAIRRKMFQDLEFLNQQLTQLAAVEKAKYLLMEKFMQISANLNNQREQGRSSSPTTTTTNLLQPTNNNNTDSDDGTNEDEVNTATATTTTNVNVEEMNGSEDGTRQEVQDINNEVIFTESDLSIGAEETVEEEQVGGERSEELDIIGSLV